MEDKIQVQGKEEVSSPAICKNCETETNGHYCHFCGQRYHDHKESFGELVYEFASDFVHFDSRFFKTVLPLIFKPGKVTRSYNEGKQRSQFHPIRLYMFSSFVYFLLFFSFNKIETEGPVESRASDSLTKVESISKLQDDSTPAINKAITDTLNKLNPNRVYNLNFHLSTTPDMEELLKKKVTPGQYLASQKLMPAKKRDDFLTRMLTSRILKIGVQGGDIKKEYNKQLFESFLHNIPKTLFFLLPVFALLLKLLYIRHKQYFYVDHAILSLHYFSFIFLLLVISHYVLGKLFDTDIFTSLSVLWILAWLFIAMKKIYAQSWKKTFLKFTLLGFVFLLYYSTLPFYEPDLERFYALRILHINPMLNRNPLSLNLRQLLLGGFILLILFSCKKDPSNDPVIPPTGDSTDPVQYETPFAGVPNTSDIVMYEINERAFSVAGNFQGILPRLDSIKTLGVNVIWLMPVHPIGSINTVNSPYCIKNYREVNPEYGTLEDLRTLVREAHTRNMAVILDWAANHTSWDNPWIQHKSWYTQDQYGNIIHPAGTNWQDVADLNFSNDTMRLEMIRCLKYWILTANIDGYRCDAADFVPYSFWKQAIDTLRNIPGHDLIMLAEGARADHFSAGFQINFSWDFFNKNKNVFKNSQPASGYYETHLNEYNNIPAGSHKLRFTSNHDECAWDDTPLGLFGGKDASMAAFVISAFMGGVPLFYNGQEVGCPVKLPFFSRSPIDWSTNPGMLNEYKELMGFRAAHPAIQSGELEYYSSADIAAFKRKTQGDEVLVIVNTRNSARDFTVPANLQGTTWQNISAGSFVSFSDVLNLSAFEYRIFFR